MLNAIELVVHCSRFAGINRNIFLFSSSEYPFGASYVGGAVGVPVAGQAPTRLPLVNPLHSGPNPSLGNQDPNV